MEKNALTPTPPRGGSNPASAIRSSLLMQKMNNLQKSVPSSTPGRATAGFMGARATIQRSSGNEGAAEQLEAADTWTTPDEAHDIPVEDVGEEDQQVDQWSVKMQPILPPVPPPYMPQKEIPILPDFKPKRPWDRLVHILGIVHIFLFWIMVTVGVLGYTQLADLVPASIAAVVAKYVPVGFSIRQADPLGAIIESKHTLNTGAEFVMNMISNGTSTHASYGSMNLISQSGPLQIAANRNTAGILMSPSGLTNSSTDISVYADASISSLSAGPISSISSGSNIYLQAASPPAYSPFNPYEPLASIPSKLNLSASGTGLLETSGQLVLRSISSGLVFSSNTTTTIDSALGVTFSSYVYSLTLSNVTGISAVGPSIFLGDNVNVSAATSAFLLQPFNSSISSGYAAITVPSPPLSLFSANGGGIRLKAGFNAASPADAELQLTSLLSLRSFTGKPVEIASYPTSYSANNGSRIIIAAALSPSQTLSQLVSSTSSYASSGIAMLSGGHLDVQASKNMTLFSPSTISIGNSSTLSVSQSAQLISLQGASSASISAPSAVLSSPLGSYFSASSSNGLLLQSSGLTSNPITMNGSTAGTFIIGNSLSVSTNQSTIWSDYGILLQSGSSSSSSSSSSIRLQSPSITLSDANSTSWTTALSIAPAATGGISLRSLSSSPASVSLADAAMDLSSNVSIYSNTAKSIAIYSRYSGGTAPSNGSIVQIEAGMSTSPLIPASLLQNGIYLSSSALLNMNAVNTTIASSTLLTLKDTSNINSISLSPLSGAMLSSSTSISIASTGAKGVSIDTSNSTQGLSVTGTIMSVSVDNGIVLQSPSSIPALAAAPGEIRIKGNTTFSGSVLSSTTNKTSIRSDSGIALQSSAWGSEITSSAAPSSILLQAPSVAITNANASSWTSIFQLSSYSPSTATGGISLRALSTAGASSLSLADAALDITVNASLYSNNAKPVSMYSRNPSNVQTGAVVQIQAGMTSAPSSASTLSNGIYLSSSALLNMNAVNTTIQSSSAGIWRASSSLLLTDYVSNSTISLSPSSPGIQLTSTQTIQMKSNGTNGVSVDVTGSSKGFTVIGSIASVTVDNGIVLQSPSSSPLSASPGEVRIKGNTAVSVAGLLTSITSNRTSVRSDSGITFQASAWSSQSTATAPASTILMQSPLVAMYDTNSSSWTSALQFSQYSQSTGTGGISLRSLSTVGAASLSMADAALDISANASLYSNNAKPIVIYSRNPSSLTAGSVVQIEAGFTTMPTAGFALSNGIHLSSASLLNMNAINTSITSTNTGLWQVSSKLSLQDSPGVNSISFTPSSGMQLTSTQSIKLKSNGTNGVAVDVISSTNGFTVIGTIASITVDNGVVIQSPSTSPLSAAVGEVKIKGNTAVSVSGLLFSVTTNATQVRSDNGIVLQSSAWASQATLPAAPGSIQIQSPSQQFVDTNSTSWTTAMHLSTYSPALGTGGIALRSLPSAGAALTQSDAALDISSTASLYSNNAKAVSIFSKNPASATTGSVVQIEAGLSAAPSSASLLQNGVYIKSSSLLNMNSVNTFITSTSTGTWQVSSKLTLQDNVNVNSFSFSPSSGMLLSSTQSIQLSSNGTNGVTVDVSGSTKGFTVTGTNAPASILVDNGIVIQTSTASPMVAAAGEIRMRGSTAVSITGLTALALASTNNITMSSMGTVSVYGLTSITETSPLIQIQNSASPTVRLQIAAASTYLAFASSSANFASATYDASITMDTTKLRVSSANNKPVTIESYGAGATGAVFLTAGSTVPKASFTTNTIQMTSSGSVSISATSQFTATMSGSTPSLLLDTTKFQSSFSSTGPRLAIDSTSVSMASSTSSVVAAITISSSTGITLSGSGAVTISNTGAATAVALSSLTVSSTTNGVWLSAGTGLTTSDVAPSGVLRLSSATATSIVGPSLDVSGGVATFKAGAVIYDQAVASYVASVSVSTASGVALYSHSVAGGNVNSANGFLTLQSGGFSAGSFNAQPVYLSTNTGGTVHVYQGYASGGQPSTSVGINLSAKDALTLVGEAGVSIKNTPSSPSSVLSITSSGTMTAQSVAGIVIHSGWTPPTPTANNVLITSPSGGGVVIGGGITTTSAASNSVVVSSPDYTVTVDSTGVKINKISSAGNNNNQVLCFQPNGYIGVCRSNPNGSGNCSCDWMN